MDVGPGHQDHTPSMLRSADLRIARLVQQLIDRAVSPAVGTEYWTGPDTKHTIQREELTVQRVADFRQAKCASASAVSQGCSRRPRSKLRSSPSSRLVRNLRGRVLSRRS